MGTWCKNNYLRFTPLQAITHFQFVFLLLPWSYQLIQSGNNSPHCDIIFLSVYNSTSPFFTAHLQGECCHVCCLYHDLGISGISLCWGIINDICSQPSSVALPPWWSVLKGNKGCVSEKMKGILWSHLSSVWLKWKSLHLVSICTENPNQSFAHSTRCWWLMQ